MMPMYKIIRQDGRFDDMHVHVGTSCTMRVILSLSYTCLLMLYAMNKMYTLPVFVLHIHCELAEKWHAIGWTIAGKYATVIRGTRNVRHAVRLLARLYEF